MYHPTPYAVDGRHFRARRYHRPLYELLPSLPFVADDEQRQLVDAINEIRAQEGPYSADLLDPFTALAVLYRESGDRTFATAAIEQALQIVRANYGLRSLEQAPLLREQVLNEKDSGNAQRHGRSSKSCWTS